MRSDGESVMESDERRAIRFTVAALVGAAMLVGAAAAYFYTTESDKKPACGRACDAGDPDDCPQGCICYEPTRSCIPNPE